MDQWFNNMCERESDCLITWGEIIRWLNMLKRWNHSECESIPGLKWEIEWESEGVKERERERETVRGKEIVPNEIFEVENFVSIVFGFKPGYISSFHTYLYRLYLNENSEWFVKGGCWIFFHFSFSLPFLSHYFLSFVRKKEGERGKNGELFLWVR